MDRKYTKYAGGGKSTMPVVKSQSVSEGWKNIKSEVGKAFDFFKKKKKKPGDEA